MTDEAKRPNFLFGASLVGFEMFPMTSDRDLAKLVGLGAFGEDNGTAASSLCPEPVLHEIFRG